MPERHAHGDFLQHFTPGLLNPEAPTPANVSGHSGKSAHKRFNVYRNNVTASLVNAIGQVFPLTRKAMGEEAFRAAALTFVRDCPPTSKILFQYGHGFDAHLAEHGFDRERPWLCDLARLERAWLDAYHAADADPLQPAALGAIAPEKLGEAVFEAHPATRIIACATPAVSVMAALKSDADPAAASAGAAETALITRPALAVDLRSLAPAVAVFFTALAQGTPLGEAAGAAQDAGNFDLAAAIGAVLETGAFTAVHT